MRSWVLFFVFFLPFVIQAQTDPVAYYDRFKERSIQDRFFKHKDIDRILSQLEQDERFGISKVGTSIEGRAIKLVRIGNGPTKVLLWSQMHGDETTATMAMMDLFRYFQDREVDEELKTQILSELSLYFIPMLNPDGAEKFDRRNALGVDLNRDAVRLQCPESRILKRMVDSLQPEFGFNLHDQSRYYTAGEGSKSATFSFLAPAFNYARDINPVRLKAIQLIGDLNAYSSKYFPEMIGRYNDAFEPRAFGDNITKWGTSTILIECGGLNGDPEKQEIRKVHFGLYVYAFQSILRKNYLSFGLEDYVAIPNNNRGIRDLILTNVRYEKEGVSYLLDLAFMQSEVENAHHTRIARVASLVDIGDLSTSRAYASFNADSLLIQPAKVYPRVLESNEINKLDFDKLLKDGYGIVLTKDDMGIEKYDYPLAIVQDVSDVQWHPEYQSNPSFFLVDSDQSIRYWLHNGNLYPLD